MGKINVACYRLPEDAPYTVTDEQLAANEFRHCISGEESKLGFVVANPEETRLQWPLPDGGTLLRLRLETRKPAPKLVKQFARKQLVKLAERRGVDVDQLSKEDHANAEEECRQRLWSQMEGDSKYFWALLAPGKVFVFARGSKVESITGLLRRTIGTLPAVPYWDGHLFHAAMLDYLLKDNPESANAAGISFQHDICLKAGSGDEKQLVKLEGHEDLLSPAIKEHLKIVSNFESVGATWYDKFFTVTPYGNLTFSEATDDIHDAETVHQVECGTAMLAAQRAIQFAEATRRLCDAYDEDERVELPLP